MAVRKARMAGWTFWEWVAYGGLLVAAIILAADAGIKIEPELMQTLPAWLFSPYFAFSPLVLIIMSSVILAVKALRYASSSSSYHTAGSTQDSMGSGQVRVKPHHAWRYASTFRLRQAACLMADIEPNDPAQDVPAEANAWFQVLDQAWNRGELERVSTDNPDVRIITRQSLQKFAAQRGEKRDFLIRRNGSQTNQTAPSGIALSVPPSEQFLVPQDIYYTHDTTPQIGYPHKLWIVLRNESRRDLIVSPASWETSTGDIAIRPISKHPWTPEGPGGWENNSWSSPRRERELEPIHVSRGRVIQTWIGLPGPLNDTELRRRIVSKRLGTLIIPFNVDGESRSDTIKL